MSSEGASVVEETADKRAPGAPPVELASAGKTLGRTPGIQLITDFAIVRDTGLFVSLKHGFGATLAGAISGGSGSVQIHAPANDLTEFQAGGADSPKEQLRRQLQASGLRLEALVGGFEGERGDCWDSIPLVHKTVGLAPIGYRAERVEYYKELAKVAADLGCARINGHLGYYEDFSPEERAEFVRDIQSICDVCARLGVRFNVESGPESSDSLLKLIGEINRPGVFGINFDPANFVLYGTEDPYEAMLKLIDHIDGFHLKDAKWADTEVRGKEWGTEVPPGQGDARCEEIVKYLVSKGKILRFIVEREIRLPGNQQEPADVKLAGMLASQALLRKWLLEILHPELLAVPQTH